MLFKAVWPQRLVAVLNQLQQDITPRGVIIFSVLCLLSLGTVMVASASMINAEYIHDNQWHFLQRHLISIAVAAVVAFLANQIKLAFWFKHVFLLLLITIFLLGAVLAFGKEVNGSTRWLVIAGFTFQVTEMVKVVMAIYTADFVVRRSHEMRIQKSWWGLIRLGTVMLFITGLIIAEPDFGATAVIIFMMMGVFFLAGAPLKQFGFLLGGSVMGLFVLILIEPYRWARFTSFSNPWGDPLGSGYQLTNALMAFGRGEWTGTGLGYSIQKLSYLPEAHTDFMLAILGEELGFLGVAVVLILSFALVISIMCIGYRALLNQHLRAGYLAYGIAIVFLLQIFVNAGMNMGMLPTKGLTLPFISYGGTSLMMCAVMVVLVLKIDLSTQTPNKKKEISNF